MEGEQCTSMLHPNWRALSTVHIPYKRFVTPSTGSSNLTTEATEDKDRDKPTHADICGTKIKEFYENITSSDMIEQNNMSPKPKLPVLKKQKVEKLPKKVEFHKNNFFRAAMLNDLKTLQSFDIQGHLINSRDSFGWTALMMAACEGSLDSFKYLLSCGADTEIKDKKGNTANSLAELKGHLDIVNYYKLSNFHKPSSRQYNLPRKYPEFYCKICNKKFKETSKKEHITSTVHQFNIKYDKKNTLRYSMQPSNRGLKIMVKQGWDQDSGLGPNGKGHLYPIKTVIRKQRTGLGINQNPAKVTHFKSYDLDAIKYHPQQKAKNRNDMQREQRRNQKQERRLRNDLS